MASPQETPGTDLPRYRYSRLPTTSHTRLIELVPAVDSSDDLLCRIHLVEQAQAKETYGAISYTWGRPEFTCSLIVVDDVVDDLALDNCQPTLTRIPITPSLDGALRRFGTYREDLEDGEPESLRHHYSVLKRRAKSVQVAKDSFTVPVESRPGSPGSSMAFGANSKPNRGYADPVPDGRKRPIRLWADAVCIDQDNPKEKAHHIPLMTSIYRDAARVFVWLGGNAGPRLSLKDSSLLYHPWFGRRWIIQEATVNPVVSLYSDDEILSFQDIVKDLYLKLRENSGQMKPILATRASSVMQMIRIRSALHASSDDDTSSYSICKLMRCFDRYDCADPRDRIFTLASLASDVDTREVDLAGFRRAFDGTSNTGALVDQVRRPQIMVIYEEGASVEDIYTLFGRSIGEAGNLPWVLAEASARLESLESEQAMLPSWVPDWSIHSQRPSFWTHGVDVRYPLLNLYWKGVGDWTCIDPDQPTFSITLSPAQSQSIKQRAFRFQLPLTRITQKSKGARKDHYQDVAPFRVTWRSETFPSSADSWQEIATCMKKTFHEVWRLVQIHAASAASRSAIKESPDWLKDQCAERFSYILIAGGMFILTEEVGEYTRVRLRDFADKFQDSSTLWKTASYKAARSKKHQLVGRDIDLLHNGNGSPDGAFALVMPKVAFLITRFLLSDIDFASDERWELLIRTIAWVMQGRCVFSCEVENTPPDASPMDVLGIGSSLLELDDRVMAIPFHDPLLTSERMGSLSLSNLWSRTYLVRPVSRDVYGGLGKDGCAPTFQLVGDCFLSTVRWLSPHRGLMPPEWFAMDDDSEEEAALKEKHRSHFSEVVADSVIYFV